ncbi:MAG: aspartate kinase [Alphaproteobacteria bacterium]|nr:MAG: aspartate kinase [Alphaproteobacteria bacterium]
MGLIVQKFGGTSVATTERIRNVSSHVAREIRAGHQVIVVVSAMSGVTDSLVGYVRDVSLLDEVEAYADHDLVVSSGEQVTAGLLALRLRSMGIPARAWAGWQVPIWTTDAYGKARIEEIETDNIRKSLANGRVAVITGFQGMTREQRITTLGRGGSDTSAVAIAAAFGAERCDIYTDVDGVYTTDPRIVKNARKLDYVSYEEMLELASAGAKVLQTRSVEMAMNHHVRLQVRTSFSEEAGTILVKEEDLMEKQRVTGLAYSRDEARITLSNVDDRPGISAAIFGPLADANINVDMIVQNVTPDGKKTDVTFTVTKGDLALALSALEAHCEKIGYQAIHQDANVAKLSAVGVGMRSHAGVAQEMFRTLAEKGINIIVITTSEIKISVLIEESYIELALRALHDAYGLHAVVEKG